MAFAGNRLAEGTPGEIAAFDAVFSNSPGGAEQLLSILKDLAVSDMDRVLLDAA